MYLSRLILNPRDRTVRRDLANCHELHRTLLSAFPELPAATENAREMFSMLHRVETDPRSGVPRVLVQSRPMPDWSTLPGSYLQPDDPFSGDANPACRPLDEAWEQIRDDMELVFRLRANPTVKVDTKTRADGKRGNGRRVLLRDEPQWIAWIERKGSDGGFAILHVNANAYSGIPGWPERRDRAIERYGMDIDSDAGQRGSVVDMRANPGLKITGSKGRGENPLTFGSVLFEGRLRVTDADRFRQTLERGIGSGKAYGFGLLSIARGN